MKEAKDVIPWAITDISIRPFDGLWSFNPSIHFDGQHWRCVLRCCDYAMPDGVTIRSKNARSTGQQTKNAMVIFDPASWKPVTVFKMLEKDDHPRVSTPHVGYEDMRIFRTDKGGLQGIAASLHLQREGGAARAKMGTPQHQPPEQVLLSFDDAYNIVAAKPIRGNGFSGTPQKNWVPFDHCVEPRFLYSIGKGRMFDDRGEIQGEPRVHASAAPNLSARPFASMPSEAPAPPVEQRPAREEARPPPKAVARRVITRGGDVQLVRGRRVVLDTQSSRPTASRAGTVRTGATRMSGDSSVRVMGGGTSASKYHGLRGGTQLVRVGEDAWLGVGHDMKFVSGKKFYWHTWYTVDARGKVTATSEPMKLAPNGIEFAAGMGIDGDRVVVSFGVDDMECKLGETRLSAVMGMLRSL